jgi:hypothetical protein
MGSDAPREETEQTPLTERGGESLRPDLSPLFLRAEVTRLFAEGWPAMRVQDSLIERGFDKAEVFAVVDELLATPAPPPRPVQWALPPPESKPSLMDDFIGNTFAGKLVSFLTQMFFPPAQSRETKASPLLILGPITLILGCALLIVEATGILPTFPLSLGVIGGGIWMVQESRQRP